jgi:hypothetical protein
VSAGGNKRIANQKNGRTKRKWIKYPMFLRFLRRWHKQSLMLGCAFHRTTSSTGARRTTTNAIAFESS